MDSYQALQRLQDGNERYVAAKLTLTNEMAARRAEVAEAQHPFAAILGCSDSRVPPEIVFDHGLGSLFVIRVAGNLVSDFGLGSLEYAVAHLHIPLILVLGHNRCGAVVAAIHSMEEDLDPRGHVGNLVDALRPAVKKAKGLPGPLLDHAIRANIEGQVARLRSARPVLDELIRQGQLRIVGAHYDLDTGHVELIVA